MFTWIQDILPAKWILRVVMSSPKDRLLKAELTQTRKKESGRICARDKKFGQFLDLQPWPQSQTLFLKRDDSRKGQPKVRSNNSCYENVGIMSKKWYTSSLSKTAICAPHSAHRTGLNTSSSTPTSLGSILIMPGPPEISCCLLRLAFRFLFLVSG